MKARLSGDNVRKLNALVAASRRDVERFHEQHPDDDYPGPVIRNLDDALSYCIDAATREVVEADAVDNDAYQSARTAAWERKKKDAGGRPTRPTRPRPRTVPTAAPRAANRGPRPEPVVYEHVGREKAEPKPAGRRRGGSRSSSSSSSTTTETTSEGASE